MSVLLVKSYDFFGSARDVWGLFKDEPHVFCLDSHLVPSDRDRYSFIGFAPFEVLQARGKDVILILRQKYVAYRRLFESAVGTDCSLTPLSAGIVGYLGYDYGLHQEGIPLRSQDDLGLPDAFFGFYDCILTIDHIQHKLHITSTGLPERTISLRRRYAARRLEDIERRLARSPAVGMGERIVSADKPSLELTANFSKDQYLGTVAKALDYIERGDIYQINLSQRFMGEAVGGIIRPWEIYTALRELSPVSCGGYLDAGHFQLMSNSPEMFLRLRKGVLETRPMKGTRPRGHDAAADRELRSDIEQSAKDRAELLMITDLERNDLGRVCRYGSVKVKAMRTIEEYPYVFQATSSVCGLLREDKDCFDILRACFPGGSVTGCPKIRAMHLIEELEPTRRGPYTGSLGYISFSGDMEFNILIRTLIHNQGRLYFQVGGGIVVDSSPEDEYEETLVKARALRTCLESVFEKKRGLPGHVVDQF